MPMKITCLLALSVSLSSLSFAQTATPPPAARPDTVKTANKLDAKGRRQGEWKRVDVKGKTIFIGSFKDDKPIGIFKYYDTEERLMTVSNFAADSKSCRSMHYTPTGKKEAEGKYVNTEAGKWVKDSIWRFYNGGEILITEETYSKGVLEGVSKNYYPESGKVLRERTYKAGKLNGPGIEYFMDGSKKSEATYVNDKMEGKAVFYNASGGISVLGLYKNDFKEGVWIYYNSNGTEKMRQTYIKGKLQGDEPLITPEEMQKQKQQHEQNQQDDPNNGGGGGFGPGGGGGF